MGIIATNKGGGNYEPIPAGTYAARCYSMIHIGTIEETFKNELKKVNKVRISWELPTELKIFKEENGEQPHVISKEFTLSMHEKANLRKFLEGWRGKAFTDEESKSFDITVLIGKPCLLSIIHRESSSGNKYAEIASVSALPKGMTVPDQINDSVVLTYSDWSDEKFQKLPDWLRTKIESSEEYKTLLAPHETVAHEPESDLPWEKEIPF